MEFVLIVILILAALFIFSVYTTRTISKKRFAHMLNMFGQPPVDTNYELESIASYAKRMHHNPMRIDNITWNDLDMDNVFKRINTCISSTGEEYLYNLLHEINLNDKHLTELESIIEYFEATPKAMLILQKSLFALGKRNHNGVANYIFDAEEKKLKYSKLYIVMAALPLVFAALLLFNVQIGVIGIILSFLTNLIAYYRVASYIEVEIPTINYITGMANCCKNIANSPEANNAQLPVFSAFKALHRTFKALANKAPAGFAAGSDNFVYTYINILFLIDLRSYNRCINIICKHKQEVHEMYSLLGKLDVAICTMSFRKSLPFFATPTFVQNNSINFTDIYHPLITNPVSNSGHLQTNSLITGSNASGKSSFIKATAINGMLAQTINTVTAKNFTIRHSIIISSMAVRDDLLGGDSYFMVEIKSIKRIIDLVENFPCICFIDEILRGTNTIERIAASTAVLTHLAKNDCLCVVATHDIELTEKLPYENYHFSEQLVNGEVVFDYMLKHGPSTSRNAIKLLSMVGFQSEITEMAEMLADR